MTLKIKRLIGLFKKKRYLFLLFIFTILGIFLFQRSTKAPDIKTLKAQKQSIKSTVVASGSIKAKDLANLTFSSAGKVAWVGVKEGDTVFKGQATASLDREKFEISLRQAQQEVIEADAALQKVYDSLPKDKVESFTDKVNRTAAEATKNQAFDALKEAERQLRNATIYSPIAGTITKLNIIPGQEVQITTDIATVADITSKVFTSEVDETDIGKIKENQKAEILLDAIPDKIFESQVWQIAQQSTTTSTGATAFIVKLILDNNQGLRIGMNGEASITIDQKDGVITVPAEAIVDDRFVWVKTASGFQKVEIEKGIESDFDVEITRNINEGDEVVVSGSEEIGRKSWLQKLISRNSQ